MRERSWRSLGLRFSRRNTNVPFGLRGERGSRAEQSRVEESRVELIKN